MAGELHPDTFTAVFARLSVKSAATGAAAMTSLALAVERRAKDNLGRVSHPYGTPTPAAAGGPPAKVSGTLRRSVGHSTPVITTAGAEVKVGLKTGLYPTYPRTGDRRRHGAGIRTPSSKYGYFLETGLRNGAKYPFLKPAFRQVVAAGDVGRYVAAAWRETH